jgi:iron only hydrogenase large subunit-like protein
MEKNSKLKFPLQGKYVALVAPSFVVDFKYPELLSKLRKLGFKKILELTFGAKLVNKEYYKIIQDSKNKNQQELFISSVCPGVVETIKNNCPQYKDNLLRVDSPMIAMAKICKNISPKHKIIFISPCNFKKIEAEKSKLIDFVIDYKELKQELDKLPKIKKNKLNKDIFFDKFYNDYTKIYPLSGGLSKTLKIKNILHSNETLEIDGMNKVLKFLKKPDKKIKFLDVTFCKGGCIGGPCVNTKLPLLLRKRKVLKYLRKSNKEKIPENRKGIFDKARGLSFKSRYTSN